MITQGWRVAVIRIHLRPLHPLDRIVRHGILVAEVLKEGGERGELAANRRAC